MQLRNRLLLALLLNLFLAARGFAASSDESNCDETTLQEKFYAQAYNLSYNSTLTTSNNAYSNRYLELSGQNSYEPTKTDSWSLSYRGQKILDDKTQKYVAMQLDLGYTKKFCLNENLKLNIGGLYGAPVNRDLIKYDHSRGQVAGKTSLNWEQGDEGFALSLSLIARRHFYDYTDNSGGKILKKYSLEPGLELAYSIDELTFSIYGAEYMGWDFNGEQLSTVYYHEESISYDLTEKWSVGLAHRSDGELANYGGTGYDIHFHDKDRSELALTISFAE